MSTTILTSLSTYMSKTSSMTTSKLKFVILKRLNKWKIKKKFRGGSCPGGKCTKVGGGRCHKNRGGRCHKNGGGKCPGGKCNTTEYMLSHFIHLARNVKCWHIRRVMSGWGLLAVRVCPHVMFSVEVQPSKNFFANCPWITISLHARCLLNIASWTSN